MGLIDIADGRNLRPQPDERLHDSFSPGERRTPGADDSQDDFVIGAQNVLHQGRGSQAGSHGARAPNEIPAGQSWFPHVGLPPQPYCWIILRTSSMWVVSARINCRAISSNATSPSASSIRRW